MSWNLRLSGGLIAAAALCTLATARPARAITAADLPGEWRGYGQSAIDGHLVDPCVDIARVSNRRFQGTVEIDPCLFPVEGTVSADGVIDGRGTDADGETVQIHGKTRALADGSVRVAALLYRITGGDLVGGDEGAMALVQMEGGLNWNAPPSPVSPLTGDWSGRFADRSRGADGDGSVRLGLSQEPAGRDAGFTTAITGQASFIGPSLGALTFDLAGTGGLPAVQRTGGSTFAALGVQSPTDDTAPTGQISLLIGLVNPPDIAPTSIHGSYRVFGSAFDMFLFIWFDTDTTQNEGSFSATLAAGAQ
jgi:hypothetical protein